MLKKCTQCGKRLDLSKFYKDRNSHKNRCKSCMSTKTIKQVDIKEIIENMPLMRVNDTNKQIEKETGLILSGYISIDGYAVPVFLKEYNKEKLMKIESTPIRRVP